MSYMQTSISNSCDNFLFLAYPFMMCAMILSSIINSIYTSALCSVNLHAKLLPSGNIYLHELLLLILSNRHIVFISAANHI